MKIAVFQNFFGQDNHFKLFKANSLNTLMYCNKYSYDYLNFTNNIDTSRPHSWSRFLIGKKILPLFDYVFFLGADCVIMNFEIKLESLIDQNFDFGICEDPNGPATDGFWMKNCDFCFKLLDEIYSKLQFKDHGWREQMAFDNTIFSDSPNDSCNMTSKTLKEEYKNKIKLINFKKFGSHPNFFEKEDFMLNTPGYRPENKHEPFMDSSKFIPEKNGKIFKERFED